MRVVFILLVTAGLILGLGYLPFNFSDTSPIENNSAVQHVTPEYAFQLMTQPQKIGEKKPIVVDVRSPEEYFAGHVRGAINIPIEQIDPGSTLPNISDLDQPIIIYSRSGVRADRAGRRLVLTGYKNLYTFNGIKQWPYALVAVAGEPSILTNDPL